METRGEASNATGDPLESPPADQVRREEGGSPTPSMMELIATDEHFIFLKLQQCEHALWCSRTTGAFSIRASWDLARSYLHSWSCVTL